MKYELEITGCFHFTTRTYIEADSLQEAIEISYNDTYDPISTSIEKCEITSSNELKVKGE